MNNENKLIKQGDIGAALTGVGAGIAATMGGPIGLVLLMTAANMVPAIYNEKNNVDREVARAQEELHKNNKTFFDARIGHRYELNREPSQAEWAEISERYMKESGGAILKSMKLID